MHCESCRRRADWDVLRDFFYREQTMLQEQQNAQAQVAAMQLTQYSLQGRLVATEQERDTFQLQTFDLQHQIGDLHAQYNHLFGRFAREQTDHITTNERYTELWQTYQASESALERKTLEVQQQDTELQVAHAAVKEMGDMLSKIVYSEDMAAEAIDAANGISDLILRNQFLAAEVARLRSELGDENKEHDEDCQYSPSLTDAPTMGKLLMSF
jgi:hypothetical protein